MTKNLITAIVTPMKEDFSIDFDALERIVEFQIENGASGLVVNGTTGEASTLSMDEKRLVVQKVVEVNMGRVQIICGVSSNDTQHVVEEIENIDDLKIDGYLLASPYYNKCSQQGLIMHVEAALLATVKPFILYNIPGRCGMEFSLETLIKLSGHPQIVGLKEASGDIDFISSVCSNLSHKLNIYIGNDDQIIPAMSLGCVGVISAVSNFIPKQMSEICTYMNDSDLINARSTYFKYEDIIKTSFIEVNPIAVKYVSAKVLGFSPTLRMPLCLASDDSVVKLDQAMEIL